MTFDQLPNALMSDIVGTFTGVHCRPVLPSNLRLEGDFAFLELRDESEL